MSAIKEEFYEDCSFVSIHYIICECGQTFPSENGLRAHLEKEHPHKRERKEFKCGVCGLIFGTESECIGHYESAHFSEEIKEEDDEEAEQKHQVDDSHEILESQLESQLEIAYEEEQTEYQEYQEELSDQHEYEEVIQEEEEVTLQEEIHEMSPDDSSHAVMSEDGMAENVKLEGGCEVDADTQAEIVQATNLLVKANAKPYSQARPPPLKMVRDAETGQLVLVFNRARPVKKQDQTKPPKKSTNRAIICEVCGRNYASNAALKYHQRVHTGEKPYRCHLCPKGFTMPLFLQIHVRTHTGERPYQCQNCTKAFSNKAALLRHERVHTGDKPYECPMCFKSFTQSNSMKLHVATVHLKQPAPYKSRARRLKETGVKQDAVRPMNKIKAFAPSGVLRRGSVTELDDVAQSEGEYEVVISEEVQDTDNMYEVLYGGEE